MSITISKQVDVPEEIYGEIFSYLNVPSLGRCQQVSEDFYKLAGNDELWRILFKNAFGIDVSNGKEAWSIPVVRSRGQLLEKVQAFRCRPELEKKIRFECLLPGGNSIYLEVSFGSILVSLNRFLPSEVYQTHRCLFLGDTNLLTKPTNLLTKPNCLVSDKLAYITSIPCYEKFHSYFNPLRNQILVQVIEIKGVDVGDGNRLAYCSSIDGWKTLFKLFPLPGSTEQSVLWVGRIPLNAEFKFVKIASNGQVTWENRDQNRIFNTPQPNYSTHFNDDPISFSS